MKKLRITPLPPKRLGAKKKPYDAAGLRKLMLAGASVREIAQRLSLKSATAQRHMKRERSLLSMQERAAMEKNRETRGFGKFSIVL